MMGEELAEPDEPFDDLEEIVQIFREDWLEAAKDLRAIAKVRLSQMVNLMRSTASKPPFRLDGGAELAPTTSGACDGASARPPASEPAGALATGHQHLAYTIQWR